MDVVYLKEKAHVKKKKKKIKKKKKEKKRKRFSFCQIEMHYISYQRINCVLNNYIFVNFTIFSRKMFEIFKFLL
jgi:hypothetical protein